MEVKYISDGVIVLEASVSELRKINSDLQYKPQAGDKIDVINAWDYYMRLKSKKEQLAKLGANLTFLAEKL